MLSLGGSLGGLSLRRPSLCCDWGACCSCWLSRAPEEEPDDPPLPATLYGSSSGMGMRGRLRMSTTRFTENQSLVKPPEAEKTN